MCGGVLGLEFERLRFASIRTLLTDATTGRRNRHVSVSIRSFAGQQSIAQELRLLLLRWRRCRTAHDQLAGRVRADGWLAAVPLELVEHRRTAAGRRADAVPATLCIGARIVHHKRQPVVELNAAAAAAVVVVVRQRQRTTVAYDCIVIVVSVVIEENVVVCAMGRVELGCVLQVQCRVSERRVRCESVGWLA